MGWSLSCSLMDLRDDDARGLRGVEKVQQPVTENTPQTVFPPLANPGGLMCWKYALDLLILVQLVIAMRSICLAAVGGAAVAVSAFNPGSSSHTPCHVGVRQLRSETHADVSSTSVRSTSSSRQQQTSSLQALPWSRRHGSSNGSNGANRAESGLFRQRTSDSVGSDTAEVTRIVVRAMQKVVLTIRRTLAIASAAALIYFGSAHLNTSPSHANTAPAATAPPVIRMLSGGASASRPGVQLASSTATAASKARLDQMVDRYVKKHMFADDAYDPFESAYREAHADQTTSAYPETLAETAAEILGKKEVAKKTAETSADGAFDAALTKLNKLSDFLERKYGINKQLSMSSVFIAIFTVPAFAVLVGVTVFGNRQKEMTERLAEQRYGKAMMDVSASERMDDDIDAPDDDEYDSDDEDDDEDDDDDE